jgi:hypothetical protein
MFHKANKLEKLQQQLARSFKGKDGPEVRLLPEGQMVIRKNMIPNPARERGGKAETFIPGVEGYQVYVAYRSQSAYTTAATTSQRMLGPTAQPVAWNANSMKLHVDRESLGGDWLILNREGRVMSVRVECGSERVLDEVNSILAQIAAILLE